MRITKACKDSTKACAEVNDNKTVRADACNHLKAAIECLGKIAACDEVAKDSIANLGVVLLDLDS